MTEKRKQRKQKLEKGPRQATIESLGRVIVIEEFERCKERDIHILPIIIYDCMSVFLHAIICLKTGLFHQNIVIIPLKAILSESNPSKERVLEALKSLGTKTPSRDILRKTNLGLTLNDFRKHEDAEISELASKTYRKV